MGDEEQDGRTGIVHASGKTTVKSDLHVFLMTRSCLFFILLTCVLSLYYVISTSCTPCLRAYRIKMVDKKKRETITPMRIKGGHKPVLCIFSILGTRLHLYES